MQTNEKKSYWDSCWLPFHFFFFFFLPIVIRFYNCLKYDWFVLIPLLPLNDQIKLILLFFFFFNWLYYFTLLSTAAVAGWSCLKDFLWFLQSGNRFISASKSKIQLNNELHSIALYSYWFMLLAMLQKKKQTNDLILVLQRTE